MFCAGRDIRRYCAARRAVVVRRHANCAESILVAAVHHVFWSAAAAAFWLTGPDQLRARRARFARFVSVRVVGAIPTGWGCMQAAVWLYALAIMGASLLILCAVRPSRTAALATHEAKLFW